MFRKKESISPVHEQADARVSSIVVSTRDSGARDAEFETRLIQSFLRSPALLQLEPTGFGPPWVAGIGLPATTGDQSFR